MSVSRAIRKPVSPDLFRGPRFFVNDELDPGMNPGRQGGGVFEGFHLLP